MSHPASYVLDSSGAELDRLLRAARLLAPIVTAALRQADLPRGGKAIDIGCGPLGALAVLREVVGEEGTVVGVDINPDALVAARQALDRLGIDGVRLVEADLNALDLDEHDFDLAYCRLVLMHQPDPAATLRTIADLLRPDGNLIAFDFFAPPIIEPRIDAVDRAWQLIIAAMRARGAHPEASRRYRELCQTAGFDVVSERGTFVPMTVPAILHETTVLLSGARRGIAANSLATPAEVEQLLCDIADTTPSGQAWSPLTVELIARKRA